MQTLEKTLLFNVVEVPEHELELRELAELMTKHYDQIQSVTNYCKLFCALRKLSLLNISYADMAAILHKFYSYKNIEIKTTDKSIAYFTSKINNGEIDIYKPFKNNSRVVKMRLIDSEIDELFSGLI